MEANKGRAARDWAIVALLATIATTTAIAADVFWRLDNSVFDELIVQRSPSISDDIVIVTIDDESLLRLGAFPWPRDVHARLLHALRAARPKAILYDVLFVDPAPGDSDLAREIAASRPILPLSIEVPGRDGAPASAITPLPPLIAAGAVVGHANVHPDRDGVIRSVSLLAGADGRLWPHVAALATCQATGTSCIHPETTTEHGFVEKQHFLIPFAAHGHSFRRVPFSAVLDGGVPASLFTGRVVMVGAAANGLTDLYATPLSATQALMPGVEVNANVAQALISGNAITPAPAWLRYPFALIPLWLLLGSFLFARPLGVFASVVILSAATSATSLLLLNSGIWISPVAALAAIIITYPLWAGRRLQVATAFMRAELERFRLEAASSDDAPPRAGNFPDSEIDVLQGAISRSRDFQRFLSDTLGGLPDASFVMATDGTILIGNNSANALIGDAQGQHFSVIARRLLADSTGFGSADLPGENALPREMVDTSGRTFDLRWSRIREQDGEIEAWVLRLANVTEQRATARQREEALQLLTHDMRSPQISILSTLDRAEGTIPDALAQRIRYYARRTLALADGYVQLARAEVAPLSNDQENLADIVLDAADDLWPQASARRITIRTHGCDAELPIYADRQLLTRTVINLIDNAIKYSPDGAVIDCTVEASASHARLAVCDRGTGVDPDRIDRLFDRFQRSTDHAVEGAGLGLAFVRSVVIRHRGTVRYTPREGGGACFDMVLPLASAD